MLYDLLITNQYHTSLTDRNRKRGLETCIALLLLTFRTVHTLPSVQSHSATLYVLEERAINELLLGGFVISLQIDQARNCDPDTDIFNASPKASPFRWSATVILLGAAKVRTILLHLLRTRLRTSGMFPPRGYSLTPLTTANLRFRSANCCCSLGTLRVSSPVPPPRTGTNLSFGRIFRRFFQHPISGKAQQRETTERSVR